MHDDGIAELADDIYRDRVARARVRPLADKILDGGELFEYACGISKSGIRFQNPHFTEDQVRAELRRRLDIGRRNEYSPLPNL